MAWSKTVDSEEGNYSSKDLTEVPKDLLQQSDLGSLYLDFNDIKILPHEICKFKFLRCLSIIGNNLKCLPKTFGDVEQLQELYLNDNALTSLPESLCKLKKLRKIWLTGNQLEALPDEFGEISSLQILICDENSLHKLPKTFGLLENLEELELSNNSIETLSEGFGVLKSLQVLNLSFNRLGKLPDSFGNLPSLRVMDMSSNNIKSLPSTFKSVHCIEKMYFESNLLEDLPEWISHMTNIIEFSVKDNQFQAQALHNDFPKGCPELRHLDVSGNFMSKLPEDLGALKKLKFLHFGSVIGELERRNFQNGNWLSMLPVSICSLVNLRELHVDENQIRELPDDFGDLVSLELLDLGQNLLHELPESFSRLQSLRICMLSKNHLMWLPSNFGDLNSLEDLRLDDNELAELPESFNRLTQLKTLDLYSNRLTEIPPALQYLTGLIRLDLDANEFKLPLNDVPLLVASTHYPDRDPNLKDNWRGRPRQDLSNIKDKIIKVEAGSTCSDFEPPDKDLPFNQDFLIAALKQNASIWKSHSDASSSVRRPFRRHSKRPHFPETDSSDSCNVDETSETEEEETCVDVRSNGPEESDYDNDYDTDDNFEPPIIVEAKKWSGSKLPGGTQESVTAMLETENWDEEIEENIAKNGPYDSPVVYCHPTKMFYPPVENGLFTFVPCDIHERSYIKKPGKYSVMDGQFENCDNDSSEELHVDPIF